MKRLPNYSLLWVSFIVFLCTGCNPASQLSVSSPDGNLCLHVETENGKLYYELSRNGKPILDKSHLGFILKEDTNFLYFLYILSRIFLHLSIL